MTKLKLVVVLSVGVLAALRAGLYLQISADRGDNSAAKSSHQIHQTRLADDGDDGDGQGDDGQDPGDQIQAPEQQEEQQEDNGPHTF